MNSPSSTSTTQSPYDAAEASARQAAKWALGVFGAVGTALFVGVSLKNLSGLHGVALRYAAIGVGITVIGIGISVAAVLWIQSPIRASIYTLAATPGYVKAVRKDPAILDGQYAGVPALLSEYDRLIKAWKDGNAEQKDQIRNAMANVRTLAQDVTIDGHFYIFMRRFKRCVVLAFVGALAAAGGAVLFVANSGQPASGLVAPTPQPVYLYLSSSAQHNLAPLLGLHCVRSRVPAIAIGGTPSALSVVTVGTPTNGCASEFLTVTPSVGTVESAPVVVPDRHQRSLPRGAHPIRWNHRH